MREAAIRRSVAMKLMPAEDTPEDMRRFIEETQILGSWKTGATTDKGAPAIAAKGKPHLPGGRVPKALNAITMKALSLRREDR